jgi:hypothetical protein
VIKKKASELQVGDAFYRDAYRLPTKNDWLYTVRSVQRVPLRDFFGKINDMIDINAHNHILGPARMSLGANEEVWLVD